MKTVYQQLLVLLVMLGASPLASAEPPYPDPERYRETIEAFLLDETLNPPPVNAIVTTGSSSMRGWHSRIAQDLHPLSIIPRGFGGSNMYDLHYFLEDLVLRHEPRAVMLYEGDNDAALGASTEQVMRYFSAIVTKIHNEVPSTRIYILGRLKTK